MKKHWILGAVCLASVALSAPAMATGQPMRGPGSTSGGATTSTSGGATTSTSGGATTSTSGGSTSVPEPGMLGLFGLGLLAVGYARFRRRTPA